MTDILVQYSNFNKNSINIVGRKNLFLSQVAQINREESFYRVFFTPYFNSKGSIKGTRLILYKNIPGREEKQIENITIKEQEDNNIYHQQTDLV